MRLTAMGALLAFAVAIGGVVHAAPSKCDSGITKAAGKKVYCKAKVNSTAQKKGTTPDGTKLTKCETKFSQSCAKAQAAGDCMTQTQPCAVVELEADVCVATISSSPSGAFLN